jgi:hypothetical protein
VSQTKAQLLDGSVVSVAFSAGTAGAPSLTFTGDSNTGIYSPGADQVAISTAGSGRLFVDSAGRVGVGTSSPISPLDVNGQVRAGNLQITDGTYGLDITPRAYGVQLETRGTNQAIDIRSYGTTSASYITLATQNTERLRITSAGLVGVGTSNALSTVQIVVDSPVTDSGSIFTLASGGGNLVNKLNMGVSSANNYAFIQSIKPGYDLLPLLLNPSGGRVGVGTSSPTETLTVNGSIDLPTVNTWIKGGGHNVLQVDATRTYFYGGTNGVQLRTANNASELINITNAGLVGIGTSSPPAALTVVGSAGSGDAGINIASGSTTIGSKAALFFIPSSSPSVATGSAIKSERLSPDGSDLQFFTVSALGNTPVRAMTIDSSQRVGIGTTSPTSLGTSVTTLEIQGAVTTRSGGIRLSSSDSSQKGAFYIYDGAAVLGTETSHPLGLYVGNTERARIDSSGRLLVGTSSTSSVGLLLVQGNSSSSTGGAVVSLQRGATSPTSGSLLGEIRFGDSSSNNGAYITGEADGAWTSGSSQPTRLTFFTAANGSSSPTERMRINNLGETGIASASTGWPLGVYQGGTAGTSNYLITGSYNSSTPLSGGTRSFGVFTNGNVVNTNNSYGAISDIKLKENIVDANSQWDDLKALQVRKYNFKEGQTHTQIGLVAQEAELVSPGLVTESPDRDAEGNDLGTVTKSVNYSVLYMKAVKALQEAMERIEQLETSNADLLDRVTALESA